MAFPQSPLPTKVGLQLGGSYLSCGAVPALQNVSSASTCYCDTGILLNVTGDLDLRIDLASYDWTPPVVQVLCGKNQTFGLSGLDWSWSLTLRTDGTLQFQWTTAGNFGSALSAISTTDVVTASGVANGGRLALRVTLQLNNAGNHITTFYYSSTIDGSWTQIGSAVSVAGATSIFQTFTAIEVGSLGGGNTGRGNCAATLGKFYALELRNGINGTLLCGPRFNLLAEDVTDFTDLQGVNWHVIGTFYVARDWVDVTGDTNQRGSIAITSRGRSNENGTSNSSTCALELNNITGNYSPRNPLGAYYGQLGRNTHARVGVVESTGYLSLPRPAYDYSFCYDSAGISVTGDLDLRVDLEESDWVGQNITLVAKWQGTQNSFFFGVSNGRMQFFWTTDGSTLIQSSCVAPVAYPYYGRKALRVTIDVNNGSGGRTITFYESDTLAGTWTQIGSTVVQAGTTSIFDSTSELNIGGDQNAYPGNSFRRWYGMEMRNGIGGSVVANPDFTAQTEGTRTFVDGHSNNWFVVGAAEILTQNVRYTGKVAAWPVDWDPTGHDIYAPIQIGNTLRQLGQGQSALHSTLYYSLANNKNVVAYWPCEDPTGSSQFASGLAGKPAMTVLSGQLSVKYAQDTGFLCSSPLPQLQGSYWAGSVSPYANANSQFNWWGLVHINTAVASEDVLIRCWTNGTAVIWQIQIDPSGNIRLQAISGVFTTLYDSGPVAFAINNKFVRISIELRQNGTGIDYAVLVYEIGAPAGSYFNGTLASNTLGQCTRVDVNVNGTFTDTTVGQMSINSPIIGIFDLQQATNAYQGETAGARVVRLCDQFGIDRRIVGNGFDTVQMGAQLPKTLIDLLRECETADGGILYEPRDFEGLAYRTRESMMIQNIGTAVAPIRLDYSLAHLTEFTPTDDDSNTRNDITVSRQGGSSARVTLSDHSALSTQVVGTYTTQVTQSLYTDDQIYDQAHWLLNLGTIDKPRFPKVSVELARPVMVANASLTAQVKAIELGHLITIANPPLWMPPDLIEIICIGVTETIKQFTWTFSWNCSPGEPWDAGLYIDSSTRYETAGSSVAAPVTSSATSIPVVSPVGSGWGTTDLPYDITIAGEKMTVTGVTGSAPNQTLTVTRHIDGIIKAHVPGEAVHLYRRARYSF